VLYQNGRPNDIANMARAFGLGSATGIGQIPEESGRIVDPPTEIDMVNQANGQGEVQVTRLQVARFIAAFRNGGILYRPQLVERIEPVEGGDPVLTFTPEPMCSLPIQPFRMEIIQQAMIDVFEYSRGTANFRLRGL